MSRSNGNGTIAKRELVRRGALDRLLGLFRPTRSSSPTDTLGVGGTAIYGGYIQENEKDPTLTGVEKYRRFSNVLVNTAIVSAGVRYYLNLVAKAGWKFEPAEDTPEAIELAELTEDIFNDMTTPWTRVVRRAAMYRCYGYSVQEWTAKIRQDGVIGFLDVEPRPQVTIERWDVDESGTVHGMIQRSPQTQREIYLPRSRVLYVVDDSLSDSPEGIGLFRHLINPAKELARFEQLEGFGYEVDLRGVPIGRAPFSELLALEKTGKITTSERTAIEQPLKDFIQKHIKSPSLGLLLDSTPYRDEDEAAKTSTTRQWDMELLQGGSGAHGDIAGAIERKNREIARILGVEGLLLGERGAGSLALSRDKSNNFALLVDSALTELKDTVKCDLLDRLFELNGWDMDLRPTLKTDITQYRDIEQITGALADMARAGAMVEVDDPVVDEVRALLGLSRRPEEDAIAVAADSAIRQTQGSSPTQELQTEDSSDER